MSPQHWHTGVLACVSVLWRLTAATRDFNRIAVEGSHHNSNGTVTIAYGSGTVAGFVSQDVLHFGGYTVDQQDFVTAVDLAGSTFVDSPYDGILGLGFPSIAVERLAPPFTRLVDAGALKAPLFSLWLGSGSSSPGGGGELVLGGVDSAHFTGERVWTPLTAAGYWQFELQGVAFEGVQGDLCAGTGCQAIADSGTSLITGPKADIDQLNYAIGGQAQNGQTMVACDSLSQLPDLIFTIGGTQLPLTPQQYTLQYTDSTGTQSACFSALIGVDNGSQGPQWILGDAFLRAYHSVFDYGNQRIGFAQST